MTRKFISVDANSGWCAKYRRRNAHCPVKRPESAKRIVYRCSQNAKKAIFQSGGQYSTQIIPMLGLLSGRNKGSLEGSPTDLRRISATGGVSPRQLFGGTSA